jgi:hypothetical protein
MMSAALIAAAALSLPHIPTPHFGHRPLPVPVLRETPKHTPDEHGRPLAVIHYRTDGRLILAPVTVDDRGPFLFIVDSSAPRSVVDTGLVARLRLRTRRVPAAAGGGEAAALWGSTVKVAHVPIYAPQAYVQDLARTERMRGHRRIAGLLGSELFRAYVVRIDPMKRTLRIYHPRFFRPTTGAVAIPLTEADGKLYAPLQVSAAGEMAQSHSAMIDTGTDVLVADPLAAKAPGAGAATVADSLGERVSVPAGRLRSVQIGPYTLYDVWGATQGGPSVGMAWLSRFIVTFDLAHNRLYLEPTKRSWVPAATPPR